MTNRKWIILLVLVIGCSTAPIIKQYIPHYPPQPQAKPMPSQYAEDNLRPVVFKPTINGFTTTNRTGEFTNIIYHTSHLKWNYDTNQLAKVFFSILGTSDFKNWDLIGITTNTEYVDNNRTNRQFSYKVGAHWR